MATQSTPGPADGSGGVVRLADSDTVARRVAGDLLTALEAVQAEGRIPAVVLTGGTVARKVHAAVAEAADRDRVDWGSVEFWWGDERYVAADDDERNAGQAWDDLLHHLPVDPDRVHAMPASDDELLDVDAAAWDYAQGLRASFRSVAAGDPWFDVLMLGIGPDGHCASLFPGRAEVESDADVLGVRDSPKSPPERVTLGMATLRRARHVWFVATGEEKAQAVARSVGGDDLSRTPAAGPRGRESTTWYVDDAAAGLLDG